MAKKVQLNVSGTDIDGTIFANEPTLGKALAGALSMMTDGDPIKYMDWAYTLHQGKPLTLDASDEKLLISVVKNTNLIANIYKAQIIKAIESGKEEK